MNLNKIGMEQTVKQRLMEFIGYKKIGQTKFEAEAGLSRGYLNKLRKEPSPSKIQNIISRYPELNREWLLNGEGEMLVTTETYNNEPKQELPLLPVDAMAGALTGDNQGFMEYECERYLVPLFKGAEFLCRVQGNSMWPKYNSGDIVACKKVPMEHLWFQWGKSYVISTRQGVLVKRIEPSKNEGCVQICSENADKYKPFELPVTEINGVAVVVGVIRVE